MTPDFSENGKCNLEKEEGENKGKKKGKVG